MSDLDVASAQPSSSSSEEVLTPIKTQANPIIISSDSDSEGDLLESLLGKQITECYSCGGDTKLKHIKLCELCSNDNCIDTCFATKGDLDLCTRCWYKGGERDRMCRDIDPNDYKRIKKLEKRIGKGHFPPDFPYATQRVKDENKLA